MQYLQEINCELFSEKRLKVFALRLDLIDIVTGGNKYFKLKYNLLRAKELGKNTILSFGGAFSNHIAALAAEGKKQGLKTIGIIRGEELTAESNHTLKRASEEGMQLYFVNREEYRNKNTSEFRLKLQEKFGDFFLVPEGGSNEMAVKGCMEIKNYIDLPFNYIIVPCGTGGTVAGIALSLNPNQIAIGVPVLKNAFCLGEEILQLQNKYSMQFAFPVDAAVPQLWFDYHFGGYAKSTPELRNFQYDFELTTGIKLDPVYNAKSFFALIDNTKKGFFHEGSTVVIVHTGGLQFML